MKQIKGIDIVSVDKLWQYPAITEKHAFKKVSELVPYCSGVVYFAFPWATLIDLIDNGKPEKDALFKDLESSVRQLKGYQKIITVCQHIRMLEHQDLFKDAGVDVVYWSHAVKDQYSFPMYGSIVIKSFPLYPVQNNCVDTPISQREYLFSFVGARANQWYLTESRNMIIDLLGDSKTGLVKGRDKWHFNDVVYKKQIGKGEYTDDIKIKENANAEEYLNVMRQTKFSLCPSGTGPNSIRLWESIEIGVIPVVLSDTYRFPGNERLWECAALTCSEDPDSIKDLPNKLRKISDDELVSRLNVLEQIKLLYGKETFVGDIIEDVYAYGTEQNRLPIENMALDLIAKDGEVSESEVRLFVTSLISYLLLGRICIDGLKSGKYSLNYAQVSFFVNKLRDEGLVDLYRRVEVIGVGELI